MPEEQPIVIQIKSEQLVGVKNAYLEGINMYMGKVPVMFSQSSPDTLEAHLRLGACAEPQMQWELNIEFDNPELSTLQVEFSARARSN
ncbi:hypothetical protein EYQ95_03015 [Lysobacter sp. N42]|nr:hypothetical protein EYQ95_03015 [Lysobacter sp. N42]